MLLSFKNLIVDFTISSSFNYYIFLKISICIILILTPELITCNVKIIYLERFDSTMKFCNLQRMSLIIIKENISFQWIDIQLISLFHVKLLDFVIGKCLSYMSKWCSNILILVREVLAQHQNIVLCRRKLPLRFFPSYLQR